MPKDTRPFRRKILRFALGRARGGVILAAAFSVIGWTGSWHGIPELFSHFFLQYALLLIPAAILIFWARDGLWRWIASAALLGIGCAVAPFWLPTEALPAPSARLRLLQFNAALQPEPLARWLAQHGKEVDIVLVLEAGAAFRTATQTLSDQFPHHLERLDDSPFSIAMMSRLPLREARVLQIVGPDFPALQADVVVGNAALRLIGIHPPPPLGTELTQWRNRFYAALATRIGNERLPEQKTLVFGDFNSTVWSPRLRDFMARTGLSDAQRGQGAAGTWPALTARYSGLLGIPIDMTLVSKNVAVVKRRTGPDLGSDHLPVLTEIMFGTAP